MYSNSRLRRLCCVFCVALLVAPMILPVHAAMVGNGTIVAEARTNADRTEVLAFLDRGEVRAELEAMGVDPADAKSRVAAMTDAEIAELNKRIDEMPAGGGVLEVALVVFIVFVITDVIGATDIFPFIHPVD